MARGCSAQCRLERGSIGADVRVVDDLAPFCDLGLDAGAELVGRVGDRSEAQCLQTLLHVGRGNGLRDFAAPALDRE